MNQNYVDFKLELLFPIALVFINGKQLTRNILNDQASSWNGHMIQQFPSQTRIIKRI